LPPTGAGPRVCAAVVKGLVTIHGSWKWNGHCSVLRRRDVFVVRPARRPQPSVHAVFPVKVVIAFIEQDTVAWFETSLAVVGLMRTSPPRSTVFCSSRSACVLSQAQADSACPWHLASDLQGTFAGMILVRSRWIFRPRIQANGSYQLMRTPLLSSKKWIAPRVRDRC
jgi:hypothetical protein